MTDDPFHLCCLSTRTNICQHDVHQTQIFQQQSFLHGDIAVNLDAQQRRRIVSNRRYRGRKNPFLLFQQKRDLVVLPSRNAYAGRCLCNCLLPDSRRDHPIVVKTPFKTQLPTVHTVDRLVVFVVGDIKLKLKTHNGKMRGVATAIPRRL